MGVGFLLFALPRLDLGSHVGNVLAAEGAHAVTVVHTGAIVRTGMVPLEQTKVEAARALRSTELPPIAQILQL